MPLIGVPLGVPLVGAIGSIARSAFDWAIWRAVDRAAGSAVQKAFKTSVARADERAAGAL